MPRNTEKSKFVGPTVRETVLVGGILTLAVGTVQSTSFYFLAKHHQNTLYTDHVGACERLVADITTAKEAALLQITSAPISSSLDDKVTIPLLALPLYDCSTIHKDETCQEIDRRFYGIWEYFPQNHLIRGFLYDYGH